MSIEEVTTTAPPAEDASPAAVVKPAPSREETMELSDEEALERAKEHMRNDQVLVAARLLKQMTKIPDEEAVFQKEVEHKAALLEKVVNDLVTDIATASEEEEGADAEGDETTKWLPMGESHDEHRDTVSYYQLSEDYELKCRIETPVESSLLVPLLSVLIETDLYTKWLPRWNVPKIGLGTVNKLAQMGRTEQIVHFISEVPWPFAARDAVIQTVAADDIDDLEGPTTGAIAISLASLPERAEVKRSVVCNPQYLATSPEVLDIEPCKDGMKRATVEGGILIRKCPPDHVSLKGSTIEYPKDEHLILVGFSFKLDAAMSSMFPQAVINFVIQTVIVSMWSMFLKVAEEIRDGKRPEHAEAIAAKRDELYNWIDQRIEVMFDTLKAEAGGEEKKEEEETAESPAT